MDPNLNTIFEKEQVVFSTLKDYNTAYTNYVMCHAKDTDLVAKANRLGICNGEASVSVLSQKAAATQSSLNELNSALNIYNSNTDKKYRKTHVEYDASLAELTMNYGTLLDTRAGLDLQIQDLYNGTNSVSSMNRLETDATIYANILWTILATSLIYFIFIKL